MQNENIILEKTVGSESITAQDTSSSAVEYQLSQIEGMVFEDPRSGGTADWTAQLNVYTKAGSRHTSHEIKSSNGIQYYREIMDLKGDGT